MCIRSSVSVSVCSSVSLYFNFICFHFVIRFVKFQHIFVVWVLMLLLLLLLLLHTLHKFIDDDKYWHHNTDGRSSRQHIMDRSVPGHVLCAPFCCCFYFNFRLFSHDFHFNLNRANISWRINFYSGEKQLNCLVMFVYWGASTTLERNFGSHESCDNSISLYLSCKLFSEQIARTSRDYVLWNFISWHKRIFSHRYLTLKFCGFSRFLRTLLIKWNILYA